MDIKVDTSQIRVLKDFFDDLSSLDQRKIFLTAYRRGALPLMMAVKANLLPHNKTGNLSRSISWEEVPEETAILVGAFRPKGWHGHLLERGSFITGERYWRRRRKVKRGYYKGQYRGGGDTGIGLGGKSTGRMPAYHFFENAYNATEDRIYDDIEKEWFKEIDMVMRITNRKLT